jgi:spermidine/putrescine-binding protein
MEAIAKTLQIVEKARRTNEALVKGDTTLAMAYQGEIIALAGQIQDLLRIAKDGKEIKQWVDDEAGQTWSEYI